MKIEDLHVQKDEILIKLENASKEIEDTKKTIRKNSEEK